MEFFLWIVLIMLLFGFAGAVTPDAWIITKVKLSLLTTERVSRTPRDTKKGDQAII